MPPAESSPAEVDSTALLAYLETALTQLELISGEDEESRHKLDELREALHMTGNPTARSRAANTVAGLDETALSGLLDNMEQQMGALEAVLAGLEPDDPTTALLAGGLDAWGLGEAGADDTASCPDVNPVSQPAASSKTGAVQQEEQQVQEGITSAAGNNSVEDGPDAKTVHLATGNSLPQQQQPSQAPNLEQG